MDSVPLEIRLLAAAAAGQARNPVDLPSNGGLATVVASNAPNADLTRQFGLPRHAEAYRFLGGRTVPHSTIYFRRQAVTKPPGFSGSVPGSSMTAFAVAVEFWTDAATCEVTFSTSWPSFVRVAIDGQYVEKRGHRLTNDKGITYLSLAFDGQAPRKVRLEHEGGLAFGGVSVAPTETVWRAEPPPILCSVFGDSYSSGVGPALRHDAWCNVMAQLLGGWDVWQQSLPGTGYVRVRDYWPFEAHLSDLSLAPFDVVIFAGGANDVQQDPAAVQAAALACFKGARRLCPDARIIVLGPWGASYGPNEAIIGIERAVAAAVAQTADCRTNFIPASTEVQPWLFGTGNAGAPNGTGNTDRYICPDGAHPTDAGSMYLGRRAAAAVREAVFARAR